MEKNNVYSYDIIVFGTIDSTKHQVVETCLDMEKVLKFCFKCDTSMDKVIIEVEMSEELEIGNFTGDKSCYLDNVFG